MRIIRSNGFVIAIARIDEEMDRSLFSEYRIARILRLKNETALKRSEAAEIALIRAMTEYAPDTAPPFRYKAAERGKPYFEDSDIQFSISHSGEYAESGFSAAGGTHHRYPASRLDHHAEMLQQGRIQRAVAKADGAGLGIGLEKLDVTGERAACRGRTYRLAEIDAPQGYIISLAYLE